MTLLHRYKSDISVVEVPQCFNNPFYYRPHELCMLAAGEVRSMLSQNSAIAEDAARGKMFGVLVVRDSGGELGYLAAFSGLLAGGNSVPGFVPPIFDLQSPGGYFKQEESEISALNRKIKETECSAEYTAAIAAVEEMKRVMEDELTAMREEMRRCKQQRAALRKLVNELLVRFSGCKVCGHRALSPDRNGNGVVESHEWLKQCPCFDVATDEWCR